MKQELEEIENKILHKLSASEGSPVDDVDLIQTLEASKVKAAEIKVKKDTKVPLPAKKIIGDINFRCNF